MNLHLSGFALIHTVRMIVATLLFSLVNFSCKPAPIHDESDVSAVFRGGSYLVAHFVNQDDGSKCFFKFALEKDSFSEKDQAQGNRAFVGVEERSGIKGSISVDASADNKSVR